MGGRLRRKRRRSAAAITVVAALLVAASPRVDAGTDEPGIDPFPLEVGPWLAVGYAFGAATATQDGITINWDGSIPADFEFSVFDDDTAEGTWTHQGAATMAFSGSTGGATLSAVADLTFAGGGPIGGTNEQLVLSGNSSTTGQVRVDVAGAARSMPIDDSNAVSPIALEVESTTCDEAYGRWAYAVEQEFDTLGWDASFDGYWFGYRQSAEVTDGIDQLLDAATVDGADVTSRAKILELAASLLQEYNSFVGADSWTFDQVASLGARTEAVLTTLRNLSECDRRLYGPDNVERFINGLTFVIQNLIIATAGEGAMTSTQFQHLVHLGVRNAAIGPGSPNPFFADAALNTLIDGGSRILADNVDPADGLIVINDDTRRVMAIGAAMGWTYDVNGVPYDARAVYQQLGESWEGAVPGADE